MKTLLENTTISATNPTTAAPETDTEKLARYRRSEAFWDTKSGSNARRQSSHYRRQAERLERKLTHEQRSAAEIRFSDAYGGYLVFWNGRQHGGIHYRKSDACAHAEDLASYDLVEQNNWLADHGYGAA